MKRQTATIMSYRFPFAILASTVLISTVLSSSASAYSRGPLYEAADNYRDVVCDFENHVLRLGYIEREDRRLVDRLEDSTSRLRSDARRAADLDLRDLDRLNATWEEIEQLHHAVEIALFDRPCYPCNPALEACWSGVDLAHRQFGLVLQRANAIAAEQQACVHDHRIPVQAFPVERPVRNPVPVPYESYRQPVAGFPAYGSPVYGAPVDHFNSGVNSRFNQTRQQHYRQPSQQRFESRDVGAALVGALLSRVLQ